MEKKFHFEDLEIWKEGKSYW